MAGRCLLVAIMTLVPVISQLEAATSTLDFARRLGTVCLDKGSELKKILGDPVARKEMTRLERQVEAVEPDHWAEAVENAGSFEALVGRDLVDLIQLEAGHHPLEYLAVLRGLCRRALPAFYLAAEGKIPLDRGTPVPFVERPGLKELFRPSRLTPRRRTLARGHLLGSLDYSIFKYGAGEDIRVILDYSQRERLDELTWTGKTRLPRIATVHPAESGSIETGEVGESEFFDVQPKAWDEKAVLALLRRASDNEVAVLPELCLPRPDALGDALAADPGDFPPIVVAGSAHVRHRQASGGRELRANESHVYLDGKHVATARKCHPFATKHLGGAEFPEPLSEGLTGEQKTITVLAGSYTRLAVVICADLNDEMIPSLLLGAGVNLLLVPALTANTGAFNGAITQLASGCQGVSVVANARIAADGRPFLCMVAVPRSEEEQSSSKTGPKRNPPAELAVFDPNQSLSTAVKWP